MTTLHLVVRRPDCGGRIETGGQAKRSPDYCGASRETQDLL
jgi:hypothetical protein